ncbi:MAG: hypothetical protein QOJ09_2825 [Actinomycetota bacterium]|nr:hypothetical protein [Actinomycetota bacterium]
MTKVVALGGGHGLAVSLRAARRYADDITAIVSVADDGGSSGRLRQALGIEAPGDLRRCLVALAKDERSVLARAFEHRFEAGELEGHALGNILIAGLASATGDFRAALQEAGRLLDAVGRVLPATTGPVVLKGEAASGSVEGQVKLSEAGRISAVSLVPPDAEAPPEALEAIAGADQIVLGPGSLFTSVLAVAVVPAIRAALSASTAQKVYVCNLRPQDPETTGYDVAAHVAALAAHGVEPDVGLSDPDGEVAGGHVPLRWVERPLARPDGLAHDPAKLAQALRELLP